MSMKRAEQAECEWLGELRSNSKVIPEVQKRTLQVGQAEPETDVQR